MEVTVDMEDTVEDTVEECEYCTISIALAEIYLLHPSLCSNDACL